MNIAHIADKMDALSVYETLPSDLQPIVKKWFCIANPQLSYRDRQKKERVDRAFVERFFDSRDEYERYDQEFHTGPVPEAIFEAMAKLDDWKVLFDAHSKECRKMYALVRKLEPETVVETGVFNGVSTLCLLGALEENGHGRLYSIDNSRSVTNLAETDPAYGHWQRARPSCCEEGSERLLPGHEPGWILPEDFRHRWVLTEGTSADELPPLLERLGEIHLFHHDSDHSPSTMAFEFELAWAHLAPGGLVLSNHVAWNDTFEAFAAKYTDDYGLSSWHYTPRLGYSMPGSAGYAVKLGASGLQRTNGTLSTVLPASATEATRTEVGQVANEEDGVAHP